MKNYFKICRTMLRYDVLIYEPNQDLNLFLYNSLIRSGYNVVSVKDYVGLIDFLRKNQVKVIIYDNISVDDINAIRSDLDKIDISGIKFISIVGFNGVLAEVSMEDEINFCEKFHLRTIVHQLDTIFSEDPIIV